MTNVILVPAPPLALRRDSALPLLDRDLRRALAYVAPHWRRLALVLALSLVSTVLSLYIPYLSRLLIDRALLGGDSHALVRIILQFAALTLGSFALNVVSGLVYTRTSADILFEMRLGAVPPAAAAVAALLRRDAGRADRDAAQRRHRRDPARRRGDRAGVGRQRASSSSAAS